MRMAKPICVPYDIDQSAPSRNSTFGGLIALVAANSMFTAVIVIVFVVPNNLVSSPKLAIVRSVASFYDLLMSDH